MNVTIENLDRVYQVQQVAELKLMRLFHEQFGDFSSAVEKFRISLGNRREPAFVPRSLGLLKRYRFAMTAAPLGFDNSSVLDPEYMQHLSDFAEQYERLLPRFVEKFRLLAGKLGVLRDLAENPFLPEILRLADTARVALLLPESRYIPAVEAVLTEAIADRIPVISEHQLRRGYECYETLICFGARGWYPEYVFRSPRASATVLMTFSWIRGQDSRVHPALLGSERVKPIRELRPTPLKAHSSCQARPVPEPTHTLEERLEPGDLVPRIDLIETGRGYAEREQTDEKMDDRVSAKLLQLEGREGVFLESSEPSSVLTIELDDVVGIAVRRKPVSELEPGLFILLRAEYDENTGDYISQVADTLMGEHAAKLRKMQKLWKTRLRDAVRSIGIERAVAALRAEGSMKANDVNVSNWMRERNIRTEDKRDFAAIMALIGLPDETERIWKLSSMIDRAHRQAGRQVRRILLDKVRGTDLTPLEKLGKMTFELEEIGARALIAVRVAGVSDETVLLGPSQINRIFDLGRHYY